MTRLYLFFFWAVAEIKYHNFFWIQGIQGKNCKTGNNQDLIQRYACFCFSSFKMGCRRANLIIKGVSVSESNVDRIRKTLVKEFIQLYIYCWIGNNNFRLPQNAYPLKEPINWKVSLNEIIKQVNIQNAVIVWNHPGWTGSESELSRIERGISDLGTDGWEHIPFNYYDWKKKAMLPALIGSTDTHNGTFSNPERTIVYSAVLKKALLMR